MDTWATSSVTPQIACGWEDDPALFAATFPMDLRPQGPEIIRTWLFSTLLRSHLEHGILPWRHTTINGWILDPDRKKMSKSKGNVITPMPTLEEFGSDAVRYWACNGRPGTDTALDTGVMKIGRRLAIKILNASKFALGRLGDGPDSGLDAVHMPLDAALLAQLATLIDAATAAHDEFDYARALEVTEAFFWSFCDDYVELVKTRAYGEGTAGGTDSARATLALALSVLHRLFAPFLPFVTEEVWSWWQEGSVHRARLARGRRRRARTPAPTHSVLTSAAEVLGAVRREKTTNKRSMRARVALLTVTGPPATLAAVEAARGDIIDAGGVDELVVSAGERCRSTWCWPTRADALTSEVGGLGRVGHVLRRALVGDAAVQHDGGPVGHAEGGLGELLDQDDGHAAGGDGCHQLVELAHNDGCQPHGDLVEQQDLGLPGQRPRDGQHLLLAARERAGQLLAALLQPGELLVGPRLDLGGRDAAAVGPHAQVVAHRQVGEHAAAFGDGDDAGTGQDLGRPAARLTPSIAHRCPPSGAGGR